MKPKVKCYTSACLIVTLLKSLAVITYVLSYNLLKLSLDVFGSSEILCSAHGKLSSHSKPHHSILRYLFMYLFLLCLAILGLCFKTQHAGTFTCLCFCHLTKQDFNSYVKVGPKILQNGLSTSPFWKGFENPLITPSWKHGNCEK